MFLSKSSVSDFVLGLYRPVIFLKMRFKASVTIGPHYGTYFLLFFFSQEVLLCAPQTSAHAVFDSGLTNWMKNRIEIAVVVQVSRGVFMLPNLKMSNVIPVRPLQAFAAWCLETLTNLPFYSNKWSRNGSVGIVSTLWTVRPRNRISIPGRDSRFFCSLKHPIRLWHINSLLFSGYRVWFSRWYSGRSVKAICHYGVHRACFALLYDKPNAT